MRTTFEPYDGPDRPEMVSALMLEALKGMQEHAQEASVSETISALMSLGQRGIDMAMSIEGTPEEKAQNAQILRQALESMMLHTLCDQDKRN